jgi:tRNA-dihydrouridine synthase 2
LLTLVLSQHLNTAPSSCGVQKSWTKRLLGVLERLIVRSHALGPPFTADPPPLAKTGTIRFMKNGRSIFECHPLEKPRLIFQLGSADPDLAVQAAKVIAGDVSGVGLNCGCPKPFSISGGMGAALLKVPDKLCSVGPFSAHLIEPEDLTLALSRPGQILRALVSSIPLPIDVKIRLFPDPAATLTLVSQLLDTGVSALTVHCRTQDMRSSEAAMHERLREIVELGKAKGIPVIANGDCANAGDRRKIEEITGEFG